MIINFTETVCKSRTIDGLPCILVEKPIRNSAGRESESETLAVFKDDERGNELADALIDEINKSKTRI